MPHNSILYTTFNTMTLHVGTGEGGTFGAPEAPPCAAVLLHTMLSSGTACKRELARSLPLLGGAQGGPREQAVASVS